MIVLAIAATPLLAACGAREQREVAADASIDGAGVGASAAGGTTAPAPLADERRVGAEAVTSALARFSPFSARLGVGGHLVRRPDGDFRRDRGSEAFRPSAPPLEIRLPGSIDRPAHIAIPSRPGAWIDVSTLDVASVAGEPREGAVVFAGAARDLDVVHVAGETSFEELRLLRTSAAPTRARYVVRRGPEITALRVSSGALEAIDAAGHVVFATEALSAVDANGAKVAISAAIEPSEGATDRVTIAVEPAHAAFPIAIDPLWTATGAMTSPRRDFYMTVLSTGKVLAVGGTTNSAASGALSTAELYDPSTGKWTATGSMATPRWYFGGAQLQNGIVVAAGGTRTDSTPTSSVEAYNPSTGAWWTIPSLLTTRTNHTVTLLKSGKVLVAGGIAGSGIDSSAEVYDPSQNKWTATANTMAVERWYAVSVLLGNGKVLVAGGRNSNGSISVAEIYDESTNSWSSAGKTATARADTSLTLLPSGLALLVGGDGSSVYASSELYDPTANAWSSGASLAWAISSHSAALLPTGNVLVANNFAAVYDPTRNLWLPAGVPLSGHAFGNMVVLPSGGGTLLAGGYASGVTSASEIFAQGKLGNACNAAFNSNECTPSGDCGGRCESGHCVDGVCCNTGCTGSCQACAETGSVGTCSPVSGAPRAGRSCAPYATCTSGTCSTTCAADSDCSFGNYCNAGTCAPKLANAFACTRATQCGSGRCVDGVCCDSACTGQCQACNVPGAFGTCSVVTGAPHGSRTPCSTSPCGPTCDGTNATSCTGYAPATTACGVSSCTGGVETKPSFCDGAGKCVDNSLACGAYACGATSCNTSCATDVDCAAGFYCKGSACAAVEGLGTPCQSASSCASGFCTDGVCCGVASCGAGSSCAAAGASPGTCGKTLGTSCASDAECGSGHCTDGVCCDVACGGQCEACDVPSSPGTCTPVAGPPHGARKACDAGGGDPCKARQCDGVAGDTKTCVGFVASATTPCAPDTCKGATYTPVSTCDGAGTCRLAKSVECTPYACAIGGCKSACTSGADCAEGFDCQGGQCVAPIPRCSPDGLSSIDPHGAVTPCVPYRCGSGGTCLTKCTATSDCIDGDVCDVGSGTCSEPSAAAPAQSSGGCSIDGASGGEHGALDLLYLAPALLALARRRRRGQAKGEVRS